MTIKRAIIILLILALIGSGVIYFIAKGKSGPTYTTVLVEKSKIIQTVTETGTIKSANEINLSFLNIGKIQKIHSDVGKTVKKDTLLAELDFSSLDISRREAEANLDVASQSLKKIIAGATKEDLSIAKANLDQARVAYESAKNELAKTKQTTAESINQAEKTLKDLESKTTFDITTYEQAIITAQINLDNAKSTYQRSIDNNKQISLVTIDNKLVLADAALDAMDRIINDEDAKSLISVKKLIYLEETKKQYDESLNLLSSSINDLNNAKLLPNIENMSLALNSSSATLNKVFQALQNLFNSLENSITSADFTQSELDAFKTSVIAQQTSISAGISAIQTAEHSYNDSILSYNTNTATAAESLAQANAAYDNALKSARNALSTAKISGEQQITSAQTRVNSAQENIRIAEAQYNKTMAPANRYDVSLAEAKVRQAQAAIDSIKKQIENSQIKAPIDGTITKVNFKVGEQVNAGIAVISMLGQNNFEIEVLISEADIAKIKKGDKAEVTLDAFGEDKKFNGMVYFIEPAETEIQDVIYYKVKVNFELEGRDVKSGMTANITMITAEKSDILIIPSRAIIEKNGSGKFARVLNSINQIEERKITTGLSGDEGMVEIVSGLEEGEKVVTFINPGK